MKNPQLNLATVLHTKIIYKTISTIFHYSILSESFVDKEIAISQGKRELHFTL